MRAQLAFEGLERRDAPAVVVGQLPTTSTPTDPSTGIEPPFGKWYNDDVVLYNEGVDSEITPPFGKWYNDQVVLYDGNGADALTSNQGGDVPSTTPGTASSWDQAAVDALMAQYATGAGTSVLAVDVTGDGAVNLSDFALMKSGL
jgi:hypothetical protein